LIEINLKEPEKKKFTFGFFLWNLPRFFYFLITRIGLDIFSPNFPRFLGFIAKVLAAILLVLTIHEFGHYSEMKRYGVEVQEFSIGIGMPLFQYTSEDGELVSLRLVPIMAYVMPSQRGVEKLGEISSFARFNIYFAGVRNNIFTGWALVVGMQFFSVFRRRDWSVFLKDLLFSPVRILVLFFGFTVAFFHKWGTEVVQRHRFEIRDVAENEHINRVLWWSFCLGFLNFLPLGVFDGGRIFLSPILSATDNWWILFLLPLTSQTLLFFCFIRGIRIRELVDYQ